MLPKESTCPTTSICSKTDKGCLMASLFLFFLLDGQCPPFFGAGDFSRSAVACVNESVDVDSADVDDTVALPTAGRRWANTVSFGKLALAARPAQFTGGRIFFPLFCLLCERQLPTAGRRWANTVACYRTGLIGPGLSSASARVWPNWNKFLEVVFDTPELQAGQPVADR